VLALSLYKVFRGVGRSGSKLDVQMQVSILPPPCVNFSQEPVLAAGYNKDPGVISAANRDAIDQKR
jgi:hypothetical protein